MHQPGVGWCVIVDGAEESVCVANEGHVRGGGWLLVVGGGDVARDVVPEVAQGGHMVNPRPPFPRHGVGLGGAGWGFGQVRLWVAGANLGVHPPQLGVSDKVSPPVDGGHPDAVACGGWALAVRGLQRGALVSGDVQEGVEEEVSDAPPQGGCLDEDGRPDALGCARGLEAYHLPLSVTRELLPYCCREVEGVGPASVVPGGAACGRGGGVGGAGAVVVVVCGVWRWGFPWMSREGGLVVVCVGGGRGLWGLVGVSMLCFDGPVRGGGPKCGGGTAGARGGRGWVLC